MLNIATLKWKEVLRDESLLYYRLCCLYVRGTQHNATLVFFYKKANLSFFFKYLKNLYPTISLLN